jgi:hypothetical protein
MAKRLGVARMIVWQYFTRGNGSETIRNLETHRRREAPATGRARRLCRPPPDVYKQPIQVTIG